METPKNRPPIRIICMKPITDKTSTATTSSSSEFGSILLTLSTQEYRTLASMFYFKLLVVLSCF